MFRCGLLEGVRCRFFHRRDEIGHMQRVIRSLFPSAMPNVFCLCTPLRNRYGYPHYFGFLPLPLVTRSLHLGQ